MVGGEFLRASFVDDDDDDDNNDESDITLLVSDQGLIFWLKSYIILGGHAGISKLGYSILMYFEKDFLKDNSYPSSISRFSLTILRYLSNNIFR